MFCSFDCFVFVFDLLWGVACFDDIVLLVCVSLGGLILFVFIMGIV